MINIAWATTETATVAVDTSAWTAITSANIVVQLTLAILVVMSVLSWAVMLAKRKQFQASAEANEPFAQAFWKAESLDDIYENLKDHPESSMANVFRSGYVELRKLADSESPGGNKGTEAPMLSNIDNLDRSLRKAIDSELSELEGRLSFLATTGSTSPFIGLFGTVWGIMGSFQAIGATGMASLAVVAPGIAEALIATGVGLFAAIPATVGYNHYIAQVRRQEIELNSFASDFLNIVKRNFFRDR